MCRVAILAFFAALAVFQICTAENRGLTTIGDHTYYISDSSRLGWNEARDACKGMGMELLSLQNEAKSDEIMAYFRANGLGLTTHWTGGRKIAGGWEWAGTGERFTYTDWATIYGQPDDPGAEAFVEFNAVDGWFDMPASLKIHYVCE